MRRLWLLLVVVPLLAVAVVLIPLASVPLKSPEVPVASEILDVNGALVTRLYEAGGGNRIEVPIRDISQALQDGVVSIEDRHFYQHRGINPTGIARALFRNLKSGKVLEGGSTITQQLAKNLYTSGERTVRRKALELILTIKLESTYSKQEILDMYLNQVYLGHGAWGVELGAQTYFGKSAKDLTLAEAAMIAALLRSPEYYSPYNHPKEALERRNLVLQTMAELGYISQAQSASAQRQPIKLAGLKPASRQAPYFVDFVLSKLDPAVTEDIRRGGYRIFTSLDLNLQRAAETAVLEGIGPTKPDANGVPQPEAALVAVDPATGYIRAMVGGMDYAKTQYNRAQAQRQPGSAFKPFLYATVLTDGYSAANTQICEPVSFPGAVAGAEYKPTDFETDRPYHYRPMGIREAIRLSDNVVAVRWGDAVKPNRVVQMAQSLGVTSPLQADLSLSLGSSALTPLEMAGAFTAFARNGVRAEPQAILKVTDRYGNLVTESRPRLASVMDARVAYILTDIMKEVLWPGGTAGTVGNAIGGRPAAGKTGTTDNLTDAWFVGYTPDLVAAVWVGNDSPAVPLGKTGGQVAAPIWSRLIAEGLKGRPYQDFARPTGITEAVICDVSGLLANPTCPSHTELFIAGTEPAQIDPTIHQPEPGTPTEPAPAPPQEDRGGGFPWPFPLPRLPGFGAPQTGTPQTGAPQPNPAPQPSAPVVGTDDEEDGEEAADDGDGGGTQDGEEAGDDDAREVEDDRDGGPVPVPPPIAQPLTP